MTPPNDLRLSIPGRVRKPNIATNFANGCTPCQIEFIPKARIIPVLCVLCVLPHLLLLKDFILMFNLLSVQSLLQTRVVLNFLQFASLTKKTRERENNSHNTRAFKRKPYSPPALYLSPVQRNKPRSRLLSRRIVEQILRATIYQLPATAQVERCVYKRCPGQWRRACVFVGVFLSLRRVLNSCSIIYTATNKRWEQRDTRRWMAEASYWN